MEDVESKKKTRNRRNSVISEQNLLEPAIISVSPSLRTQKNMVMLLAQTLSEKRLASIPKIPKVLQVIDPN